MNIFYCCRTGHHTSVLAAYLHLGKVSANCREAKNIQSLSGYDKFNGEDIGKPFLAGIDDHNAEIYTIGVTGENHLLIRAAIEFIGIMGISPGDWRIVDTSCVSSNWTVLGQLAGRISLTRLSKTFFYLGARKELPRLKNLVSNTKNQNLVSNTKNQSEIR